MRKKVRSILVTFVTALSLASLFGIANASDRHDCEQKKVDCQVDCQADCPILIDQHQALKGHVTPGDAPGFPITITRPGSYRLCGNLTVPDANSTGIVITADNVTLDLNGFSITGPTTCTGVPVQTCSPVGSGSGIDSTMANIVVLNGIIQGMGSHGVFLHGSDKNYRVEKVHTTNNGSNGIYLIFSRGNILNGNKATTNGGRGIDAAFGSVVTGSVVDGNGEIGIVANHGSNVSGNIAINNGSYGLAMGIGAGYVYNVLQNNNGGTNPQLTGGVSMGSNVCGSTLCP